MNGKYIICLILAFMSWMSSYAKTIEVDYLIDVHDLDLRETPLGIFPGSGIFAAFGNRIVSADPNSAMRAVNVNLPNDAVINDFVFAGTQLVIKTAESIVWTSPNSGFDAYTLADDNFRLCPATDSTIYILSNDKVFEFNLKSKKPITTFNVDDTPLAAYRLRDGFLLATDRDVFSYYNKEWTLLHRHPAKINAVAFMADGIFVGSDDGLWRVAGNNTIELIAYGSVLKLFADMHCLYVLDGVGNVLSVTFSD